MSGGKHLKTTVMDKNSVKLLFFSVEGIKSKRQAKRKLGHVVQTQVCRLP